MNAAPLLQTPLVQDAPHYRFSVEEFYKLADAGIFDENDRVELLDGEIIVMSPIGIRHAATARRLNKFFSRRSNDRYEVIVADPSRLGDYSEPQPDVQLVRVREDDYLTGHPAPADVHLLIEIADSTLRYDRGSKRNAYAAAGIPEYWIANLTDECIEVFRDPRGGTYHTERAVLRGESVAPLAFPDLLIAVHQIVPPPTH